MASKDERPPRRLPKAPRDAMPDSPNPVDIAMVAAVSGKPLPEVARRLLEEQADYLHAQCVELRVRSIGERVRAALWAILAVVAFALSGLLVMLLVHAARADALIVESFRVPPAMAAKGLSGEVVASQVLDKLAEMQASTESTRTASSYDNNWGDELKIDIPNTGATADQIWKLLRAWLGKETRISGEVIDSRTGLALTARVGGTPGKRFVSKTSDLDALITQGAEVIFRETQPYRYAIYLDNDPKRLAEGMQILQQMTRDPSERERKWAYNGLSVNFRSQGDFPRAIAAANRALAIDPVMIPALSNLGSAYFAMGGDQAGVDFYRRTMALPLVKDYDPRIIAANRCTQAASIAFASRDPVGLEEAASCTETSTSSMSARAAGYHAAAAFMRHDPAVAVTYRAPVSPTNPAVYANAQDAANALAAEEERGASPALAAALEKYRTAMAAVNALPESQAYARATAPREDWPTQAEALVKLGRLPEAAALIARTPTDCYTCVRMRGLVAEATGNAREAQRWYAEAARQAPRLAPAFADWGRLLVEAGRFASAEVKLAEAARLAPKWADPLKYWGDALAEQGKRDEAMVKYTEALKLAPKWQELRQARARLGPR